MQEAKNSTKENETNILFSECKPNELLYNDIHQTEDKKSNKTNLILFRC